MINKKLGNAHLTLIKAGNQSDITLHMYATPVDMWYLYVPFDMCQI